MLVLIIPIITPAQEWVTRYNGPADSVDCAWALAINDAGDVYVTGCSYDSATDGDYATVKYNAAGYEQWVRRYNGPGDGYDEAYAIAVDGTGNVYVTGCSYGSGASVEDYTTIMYDSSGVTMWIARYNGPGDAYDMARAIAIDGAGHVYVTGGSWDSSSALDYTTVKYDAYGVEQWVVRYNGPSSGTDNALAIAVDDSGNVYVTGGSTNYGNGMDYATIKYNSAGVEQWIALYTGPVGEDIATEIAIDNVGNVYVAGTSSGIGTQADYATVKYDASGVEQWVARYNGPGNEFDAVHGIAIDNSCNAYITGLSVGYYTYYDYATVKYDSSGMEQWIARYDGAASYDVPYAIALDNAGYIYVTGTSYSSGTSTDYTTIKYDSLGVELWIARYNGPGDDHDEAHAIATDDGGNVYVTGYSYDAFTYMDYATIKYAPTGVEELLITEVKPSSLRATVYSGPLQLPENKKCRVFDITGRLVEPNKIQPGIYFIEVDGVVIQKVVKVR
jgi:hypothetical protein